MQSSSLVVLLLGSSVLLAGLTPTVAEAQGPAGRLGDPVTGRPSNVQPTRPPRRSAVIAEPDYVPPPPGGRATPQLPRGYGGRDEPGRYGQGRYEDEVDDGPGPPRLELNDRLRVLDTTWSTLGAQGGPDIGNAILSIVSGGIEIALGALFLELDPVLGNIMAPFFITLGATTVVRTIVVEFLLRPDPRGAAMEYQRMPNGTRAQRLRRLEYGEAQLAGVAERALIARIVDGSLSIGAALAVVPAYLLARGDAFQPLEAFIFIGPAISLITGIITLASPSTIEQRWHAYREMRRRMESRREDDEEATLRLPEAGVELSYGLSVDPQGGAFATVGGTF